MVRPLLAWFEVSRPAVEAALRLWRLGNTTLDTMFYDVDKVCSDLLWHGLIVSVAGAAPASGQGAMSQAFSALDVGALSNPEGVIIVVDAGKEDHVKVFPTVPEFLKAARGVDGTIDTFSVTGVGSSALGSLAFAWDLSTALDTKVAAIVPGYGVADVIQQALGGYLAFGLHGWWVKEAAQAVLARTAPMTASIGRGLMMTAPGHEKAPVFEHGSGSSDVLHAILRELPGIKRLFGHSKGALVIENALRDLPPATTRGLEIVTFGCPIAKEAAGARYLQVLGLFDALGWLNSWGNRPDISPPMHHSTNTRLPLSMPVALFARLTKMMGPEGLTRISEVAEPMRLPPPGTREPSRSSAA